VSGFVAGRRPRRFDGVAVGLRAYALVLFVFLYLPIVFVVVYSFNDGRRLLIWNGFSARWYERALDSNTIQSAVQTSVKVAALNAVVAIVLGSLAGIALARRPGRWTTPFLALVFLILVTPEIVDAIAYLIFFVRIEMNETLARLVIGHSVFGSAVVTLIVRARLSGIDESLEEAAADLGAPPTRVFRQITLPLMMPAVLAGGLLAFTFSLDDVIVSSFVSSAGTFTLPVYIFSSLRTGLKGDVAAISTLMLLLTLVAIAVAALVLRRGGDTTEDITATLTGGG
jgi:ABC-type spermidine/putrescine transport system permease subunit II